MPLCLIILGCVGHSLRGPVSIECAGKNALELADMNRLIIDKAIEIALANAEFTRIYGSNVEPVIDPVDLYRHREPSSSSGDPENITARCRCILSVYFKSPKDCGTIEIDYTTIYERINIWHVVVKSKGKHDLTLLQFNLDEYMRE